jgi:hypothetical protein
MELAYGVWPMIDRQRVETVLRRRFAVCLGNPPDGDWWPKQPWR